MPKGRGRSAKRKAARTHEEDDDADILLADVIPEVVSAKPTVEVSFFFLEKRGARVSIYVSSFQGSSLLIRAIHAYLRGSRLHAGAPAFSRNCWDWETTSQVRADTVPPTGVRTHHTSRRTHARTHARTHTHACTHASTRRKYAPQVRTQLCIN